MFVCGVFVLVFVCVACLYSCFCVVFVFVFVCVACLYSCLCVVFVFVFVCGFCLFSFYSSFPMSASIARVGVIGFALSASTPFFFLALLTPHNLALTRADPAVAGVVSRIINK